MSTPEGLDLTEGRRGLLAVPHAPWRPEFTTCLLARDVVELELNQGKGWGGRDVDFLRSLPQLQSLSILNLKIQNIEAIHALHHLKDLDVQTYCRTGLRYSEFPHLESCSVDWGRRRVTGLFELATLRHLSVGHMPHRDLRELSKLTTLESLWIDTSPVERLDGIETLRSLRDLHLRGLRKLQSLDGIEACTALEELEVDTCRRVGSIDTVRSLARLRKLYLNNGGTIASLRPIESLSALEEVVFYATTNVLDGDLVPLTRLPKLRNLSFQNRRHYTHRREQFKAYTEARHD